MRWITAALLLVPLPAGTWAELGASASNGGVSATPDESGCTGGLALAADSNGWPTAAWSELGSGGADILVRRWNGEAWIDLAGASDDPAAFNVEPRVAISPFGPVVAYRKTVGIVHEILVRRWTGAAWQTLGSLGATATDSRPALAVDSAGNPVVAWAAISASGKKQVFLASWNGTDWVGIGGSSTGEGVSAGGGTSDPAIALDSSDAPVVAWRKTFSTGIVVFLKRWNGTGWVELGGSATGLGVSNVVLTGGSGGGLPGGGGGGGGGGGTLTVSSGQPSLVIDAAGAVLVAWSDLEATSNMHEVYLKRWNGAAWTGLGGSDDGGGVSQSADLSMDPSVAVAPDGTPMVAWREGIGTSDILLRAWDGAAWVELSGSASPGGISATVGESIRPQLAIGAAGIPLVAWSDVDSGNWEVYLRSWTGSIQGLDQLMLDGATPIGVGQTTPEDGLTFSAAVTTAAFGATQAGLQVELRPIGTAFDGTPTHESAMVASGSTASVTASALAAGGYHWRARVKSDTGALGAWTNFGANGESSSDVVIQSAGGGGGNGGGGSGSGTTSTGKGRPKRDGCTASAGAFAGFPLGTMLVVLLLARRRR